MRGGVKIRFIKKWLFLKGWQKTDGKSNCCPIWVRSHLDGEKVVNNVRIHLISNSHKSSDVLRYPRYVKRVKAKSRLRCERLGSGIISNRVSYSKSTLAIYVSLPRNNLPYKLLLQPLLKSRMGLAKHLESHPCYCDERNQEDAFK